jgi:triacylglycerol esterase/lipase EstA (alpha/beta hydrolase family)
MGGLVSAWYATKLAPPGTVTDVITLGSPLQGTHVARIALGPNGSQMRRNSEFTKQLQQGILDNHDVRFYHIGTKTDQLVIPHSSSWVGNDLERQFAVDDLGHVSLLFSPRIVDKICSWLN